MGHTQRKKETKKERNKERKKQRKKERRIDNRCEVCMPDWTGMYKLHKLHILTFQPKKKWGGIFCLECVGNIA